MVLESLISPFKAEKSPYKLFMIGFLYVSVAILLSLWIFKEKTSLVMVFLTVMAAVPLMYNTIRLEEEKDKMAGAEYPLLKEHVKALTFFVVLFLGMLFAFSMWFVFLPSEITQITFDTQLDTISKINSKILGDVPTSLAQSNPGLISKIFFNNMKVLTFAILFSFFYGAGAIFILTWNASVIGAASGSFIRNGLSEYAATTGLTKIASYFGIFSVGLLRYLIHGIPEILAYFTGGLAGGIISVAVIKHDFRNKNFKRIATDSLDLIMLAIFILFVAAIMEVYLTPIIF